MRKAIAFLVLLIVLTGLPATPGFCQDQPKVVYNAPGSGFDSRRYMLGQVSTTKGGTLTIEKMRPLDFKDEKESLKYIFTVQERIPQMRFDEPNRRDIWSFEVDRDEYESLCKAIKHIMTLYETLSLIEKEGSFQTVTEKGIQVSIFKTRADAPIKLAITVSAGEAGLLSVTLEKREIARLGPILVKGMEVKEKNPPAWIRPKFFFETAPDASAPPPEATAAEPGAAASDPGTTTTEPGAAAADGAVGAGVDPQGEPDAAPTENPPPDQPSAPAPDATAAPDAAEATPQPETPPPPPAPLEQTPPPPSDPGQSGGESTSGQKE